MSGKLIKEQRITILAETHSGAGGMLVQLLLLIELPGVEFRTAESGGEVDLIITDDLLSESAAVARITKLPVIFLPIYSQNADRTDLNFFVFRGNTYEEFSAFVIAHAPNVRPKFDPTQPFVPYAKNKP